MYYLLYLIAGLLLQSCSHPQESENVLPDAANLLLQEAEKTGQLLTKSEKQEVDHYLQGSEDQAAKIARVKNKPKNHKQADKDKLQRMYDLDQYLRFTLISLPDKKPHYTLGQQKYFEIRLLSKINLIDEDHHERLLDLLRKYDIFGTQELGEKAVEHAWLIVQHATHNVSFQEEILGHLKHLYPGNPKLCRPYAMLHDRVMLKKGAKQEYGTQFHREGKCQFILNNPEELQLIEKSQAEIGLDPLEEELKIIKKVYGCQSSK